MQTPSVEPTVPVFLSFYFFFIGCCRSAILMCARLQSPTRDPNQEVPLSPSTTRLLLVPSFLEHANLSSTTTYPQVIILPSTAAISDKELNRRKKKKGQI